MIPYRTIRSGSLGGATLTTKLAAIVVVFVLVIASITGFFTLAYKLTAGVRAYVGGEGQWSKGQKDAVYHLNRYISTGHERDYQDYLAAIALPLGDRKARLEMEQPEYDFTIVEQGFVQGGNAADDVPSMILLFRHFRQVPFFSQAIVVWREAEQELMQLIPLAESARQAYMNGQLSAEMQAEYLQRIQTINARVTPLEQQFSLLLSAGAREVQALLLLFILVATAALITFGLFFAWTVSRDLRSGIGALREGVLRVAMGDLMHPIDVRTRDELGDLARAFNNMVAARRRAETALLTANDFRQKVMDNASNAIYTMDMEGRFTTANRRTCEITGYPIEELIGRTWATMVQESDLPDLMAGYQSTIQGREPITNREILLIQQGGREVMLNFSIAPLRRDGVIFGVVGTAEDITLRKRNEQELNQRAEELSRSNQELEQFAYVASHDLQEPLRTIGGFAQLLARRYQGKLDPDADEFIGYITDGVTRMRGLIDDLLAYSRVQRAHAVVKPVALETILQSALANLQGAIIAARAEVTYTELPTIAVDVSQFTQLFQNLIGNAIKFRGEPAPVIRVSAEKQNRHWLISVIDNGIGISPESAERVFELFQRLHGREQYEGNGIGLTLCKKIVELHGGRIWVEPAPGGGTVFHIRLPATSGAVTLEA